MQAAFAKHLEAPLGWDSIFAWNQETFGLAATREVLPLSSLPFTDLDKQAAADRSSNTSGTSVRANAF